MKKLGQVQLTLAKKLILKDRLPTPIKTIAGFDQSFIGEKIISATVVCDYKTLEPIEKAHTISKATLPYIPGYLAFREGPPILKTYRKLKTKPDILLIDAHGIAHPRGLGLASWVGLKLNKPTIGIAKSKLAGQTKGNKLFLNSKQVGWVLGKLFVSPGHKVSLQTSLKIAKQCSEVLRLAHLHANEIKKSR